MNEKFIYRAMEDFPTPKEGSVLTVGNFDGVHLGHQDIFAQARQLAREYSLPLVGMTFDPAPVRLLFPDRAPSILTPLNIRIKLLAEQGLDQLLIVKTTREFLALEPDEFAERVLVNRLAVRHIVEGPTFNFGSRRAGTMVSLKELAERFGFQVHLTPARTISLDEKAEVTLSSTLVRELVSNGRFNEARQCMGRDYILAGQVVAGMGHGRELGFPTANLKLYDRDQLVPQDGVFAGWVQVGNSPEQAWEEKKRYPAAVSIGRCETFADGQWQIEAYLLDYEPDTPSLRDKHIILSLLERVRPQQRFDSPAELAGAIETDCKKIRGIISKLKL